MMVMGLIFSSTFYHGCWRWGDGDRELWSAPSFLNIIANLRGKDDGYRRQLFLSLFLFHARRQWDVYEKSRIPLFLFLFLLIFQVIRDEEAFFSPRLPEEGSSPR